MSLKGIDGHFRAVFVAISNNKKDGLVMTIAIDGTQTAKISRLIEKREKVRGEYRKGFLSYSAYMARRERIEKRIDQVIDLHTAEF